MIPRLALLALLLVFPTAAAAAPNGVTVAKETDTVGYGEGELFVFLFVNYAVSDPAAYNANATWRFHTPAGTAEPAASLVRNGIQTTIDASRVNASTPAGTFASWTVDLRGLLPNLKGGENHTVAVSFRVAGDTVRFKTGTASPQLVVFVENAGTRIATGTGIGPFIRSGASQHAVATGVADGFEYSVTVQDAAATGDTQNLNAMLWGVGGLVLGALLATMFAKRGVKAKKFEKGGAMESRSALEARRRTLMAALKELEVAHEAKEISDDAYAPLKEEYKAQAVRVLRSLEEKKEPGT